jgi:hypothetical protein
MLGLFTVLIRKIRKCLLLPTAILALSRAKIQVKMDGKRWGGLAEAISWVHLHS